MNRRDFIWLTGLAAVASSALPAFAKEGAATLEATLGTEELLETARSGDPGKVRDWLRNLLREIIKRGQGLNEEEHRNVLALYEDQQDQVEKQIRQLAGKIIETYGPESEEPKARRKPRWRLRIVFKFRPPEIGIVIDWP